MEMEILLECLLSGAPAPTPTAPPWTGIMGMETVGVSSPAELVGDVIVRVSSPDDLAGGVTIGAAPSAVAEVAPSADLAEVAPLLRWRPQSILLDMSPPVWHPRAVAEVASLADIAEVASSVEFAVLWCRVTVFVLMTLPRWCPRPTLPVTSRFAPLSPQGSPVSTEVVDRGVVESPEFDAAVVPSDMSTITSRFSPLNPQMSPISTDIVDRVVVELPVSDVAPVVDLDPCLAWSCKWRCASALCASGVNPHGSYGPLATPGWSGWSRSGYCTPGPGVPGLYVPCVVRGRPVGSGSRSSRTASLHCFILELDK